MPANYEMRRCCSKLTIDNSCVGANLKFIRARLVLNAHHFLLLNAAIHSAENLICVNRVNRAALGRVTDGSGAAKLSGNEKKELFEKLHGDFSRAPSTCKIAG
jgi:hypothetical protein